MTSQVTSQSTREADKEGEGNKVGGGLEDLGEKGRRGKVRREVRLATACPVSGPQRVWSRVPPQVGDLPSTPCCCLVIAPSRALWDRQPAPSGPTSLRRAAGLSPADSGLPLCSLGCVCLRGRRGAFRSCSCLGGWVPAVVTSGILYICLQFLFVFVSLVFL